MTAGLHVYVDKIYEGTLATSEVPPFGSLNCVSCDHTDQLLFASGGAEVYAWKLDLTSGCPISSSESASVKINSNINQIRCEESDGISVLMVAAQSGELWVFWLTDRCRSKDNLLFSAFRKFRLRYGSADDESVWSVSLHPHRSSVIVCGTNAHVAVRISVPQVEAGVTKDSSVRLLSPSNPGVSFCPAHSHNIPCVSYSPSGNLVATVSIDGSAAIWSSTWKRLLKTWLKSRGWCVRWIPRSSAIMIPIPMIQSVLQERDSNIDANSEMTASEFSGEGIDEFQWDVTPEDDRQFNFEVTSSFVHAIFRFLSRYNHQQDSEPAAAAAAAPGGLDLFIYSATTEQQNDESNLVGRMVRRSLIFPVFGLEQNGETQDTLHQLPEIPPFHQLLNSLILRGGPLSIPLIQAVTNAIDEIPLKEYTPSGFQAYPTDLHDKLNTRSLKVHIRNHIKRAFQKYLTGTPASSVLQTYSISKQECSEAETQELLNHVILVTDRFRLYVMEPVATQNGNLIFRNDVRRMCPINLSRQDTFKRTSGHTTMGRMHLVEVDQSSGYIFCAVNLHICRQIQIYRLACYQEAPGFFFIPMFHIKNDLIRPPPSDNQEYDPYEPDSARRQYQIYSSIHIARKSQNYWRITVLVTTNPQTIIRYDFFESDSQNNTNEQEEITKNLSCQR